MVYRPPSNTPMENDGLLSFITDFCCTRNVLVLGDFNLPTLRWSVGGPVVGSGSSVLDRSFFGSF